MKRLGCYHMTTPHPLLTSNPPKPTAPHFNAEPLTQNNCPSTQTHSGPPFTYLCLPRILLSPIILLSIPLLSRQAARMAGMETFTDGSTGKFSHPQKQKKKKKENYSKGRKCRDLTLFLHVSFHPLLSSAVLYTSSFSPSHITIFLFCVNSRGFFSVHLQGSPTFPHGRVLGKGSAGKREG